MFSAKSRSASEAADGLAQEVDLVVEQQRLEMLLDAHQVLQALEAEIAAVLAELADRGEEERARASASRTVFSARTRSMSRKALGHVRRP